MARLPILAALTLAALHAQPTGPQVLAVISSIDGTQQPYALYLPKTFDPQKQYPVLVSLHSEESNHRLNLSQVLGTLSQSAANGDLYRFPPMRDTEFIVVCPLARGTMGYQGIPEQDVYDVLTDVERRYPVDPNRVFLTGISMGGGGALWLAETRPDLWAGIAVLCGDTIPGSEELAANLTNVPVRFFHGDLDTIVPVSSSRAWQRRLLDAGIPALYTEYPLVRHNVWEFAYFRGGSMQWFAGLHRDPNPAHVHFTTRAYQYNSAYWVRIDALTPGTSAIIDARRLTNGDVQVTTFNLDAFTLTAGDPAQVIIDGAAVKLKKGAPLSFNKASAGWRQGPIAPAPKHAGAEGPIVRAISSRHMYVYGTLGAPSADELEARHKQAEFAAAWSTKLGRLTLTLPVKADREVTADDIDSSDLVLFGTPESNALIARFADRFPLGLAPDAADYGLLFIAPIGNHYVLVNSGLPWWTGADEAGPSPYPFPPLQYRTLSSFGDYILFRGGITNVVAQGRFDNNWKLPADANTRLTASGVVTVR